MRERDRVTHKGFYGVLAVGSALNEIFPTGKAPLASDESMMARLETGEDFTLDRVFFVLLAVCTPAQKEMMAQRMVADGRGTIEEARLVVAIEDEIPIRESHLAKPHVFFSFFYDT